MPISSSPSRRDFLGQSVRWTAAGGLLAAGLGQASAATPSPLSSTNPDQPAALPRQDHYLLRNVRLEEGFIREDDEIVATRTGRYDISVRDGKIDQLTPAGQGDSTLPSWDAQDALLLPATQDMHIHLDKTFYGGPWQAPRPRQGKTIMDMIAREQVLIPQLLPHSQARAEGLIALLHAKGTTRARSHCNIDPVSGLQSLEHLQAA